LGHDDGGGAADIGTGAFRHPAALADTAITGPRPTVAVSTAKAIS
jgi:hypothetical protein